ncbi:MAG: DsbA family protein [Candidatus Paceibacteria bacterium]
MADLVRNPWVIIGIITILLIGGSVWYSTSINASYNEGVEVMEHVKGNPDATVTLIEYSDFQCPACAQFAPIVDAMLMDHGDQVRFEYRHYPLIQIHPNAEPAARAAEAAGQQGKFFEYHDALFENQREWGAAAIPGALFVRYADELGLDTELFKRHQRSSILQQNVRDHVTEARELGLTGTPMFFLNGERMNFQTYQEFSDQIRTALGIEVENVPEPEVEIDFGV